MITTHPPEEPQTEANAAASHLEADALTTSGVTDNAADVVVLAGFLGAGTSERSRRLFQNATFRRWIEIADDDIVGRFSTDPTSNTAQSLVWVRRSASLVVCESVLASTYDAPPPPTTTTTTQEQQPQQEVTLPAGGIGHTVYPDKWPRPHWPIGDR